MSNSSGSGNNSIVQQVIGYLLLFSIIFAFIYYIFETPDNAKETLPVVRFLAAIAGGIATSLIAGNLDITTNLPMSKGQIRAAGGLATVVIVFFLFSWGIPHDTTVPPPPLETKSPVLSDGSSLKLEELYKSLQKKDFKKANNITKTKLFSITKFLNYKVRFENGDSQNIDCNGLVAIDKAWSDHSEGKFGFRIQKQILEDGQTWENFSIKVGWKKNGKLIEDRTQLNFDLDTAPNGHLPSTLFWITDDSDFYGGIRCPSL